MNIYVRVAALLVGLGLLIAGYFYLMPKDQKFFFLMTSDERSFFKVLGEKIENGQRTIYLNELISTPWDTVCVMRPYSISPGTPNDQIQKLIKADISGLDLKRLDVSQDNAWVFVFISEGKISGVIRTFTGYQYSMKETEGAGNCINTDAAFAFESPERITIKSEPRQ